MRIHLVGIGGTGLSAIARVLHERGFVVSGSDKRANAMTRVLAESGMRIHIGHHTEQIGAADALIYTSAVDDQGRQEVVAARARGIPTYRRAEIIQQVIGARPIIAVAGTHGKTTTTAMLVHLLRGCGRAPGFILGSTLPGGENASTGEDELFVIEADEYDDMFLGLLPETAIVTNVEHDHPDFFARPEEVADAFARFIRRIPAGGALVYCADDAGARSLVEDYSDGAKLLSYGSSADADLRLKNFHYSVDGSCVTCLRGGPEVAELHLSLAGEHNLRNAAAALLAAERYGISLAEGAGALADFTGVDRRMSLRGDIAGLAVLDDYAHHPTAIRASLQAARQRYPERQLVALWEPHTYSRLATLWDGFATAFESADAALITEVYAAREEPQIGIDGASISAAILRPPAVFAPDQTEALRQLLAMIEAPACLLIMSAGDASAIGTALLEEWGDRASA